MPWREPLRNQRSPRPHVKRGGQTRFAPACPAPMRQTKQNQRPLMLGAHQVNMLRHSLERQPSMPLHALTSRTSTLPHAWSALRSMRAAPPHLAATTQRARNPAQPRQRGRLRAPAFEQLAMQLPLLGPKPLYMPALPNAQLLFKHLYQCAQ